MFQIKKEESKGKYGRFSMEPLERGYGHTLGSALRRVLLSSLPGAAVTQVTVSGLKHQFTAIKGIKEDGADLLLNLKKLRVHYTGDKPTKITLSVRGKGEIKASKVKAPADVKIANPDLVIATLTDSKSKLDINMQVESGIGYSPAEDRRVGTIGLIPLDADFSPIERVNYKVEEARVGRFTSFDKLTVEVWTDDTLSAADALKRSAEILVVYLNQIVSPARVAKKAPASAALPSQVSNLSVEELGLPTRITNALSKSGHETVGDLLGTDKAVLAKVRNLGEKSIKIVEVALKEKGVTWEG